MTVEPETATKTAIPRPDGRGALLPGGQPGNKGGGRPKSQLRLDAQECFALIAEKVKQHLAEGTYSKNEELKAFELMGRFGMGDVKEITLASDAILTFLEDVLTECTKEGIIDVVTSLEVHKRMSERIREA